MTISTERRATPIILGTGANADIPFDFKVFRAEDILLVKSDGLNIESTLVLGNDYSVVLNPNQNEDAGGFVKLKVALAAGERAIITTNAPSLQETRLINQGGFYPDVLNNAFDYLTILIQQLETQIERVVLLPITTKIDKEKFTRNLAFLTEHVNELDALFNILNHIVIVSRISKEVVIVSKIEKDVTAVANNNTNVTKVADNEKNINAVQANETNINTVSLNIACLESICKNMLALLAVCKNETNITKVANNETNITKVANNEPNINKVADNETNINSAVRNEKNITSAVRNETNINKVADNETNITKTAKNEQNINKLVANETNINTVASIDSDVTTVATNVADVTNFSDVYLGKRNVKPATRTDGTALETGDLYFDTVKKSILVYDKGLAAWTLVSSVINAILKQFYFVATAGQNIFKGKDDNNKLLEFELDYIEIFLNGVHLNPEDFTLDTTNQSITLKEVANEKDELYVRSFGALVLPSDEIKNILTIKQKILDVSAKLKEIEAIEKKLKEIADVHGVVKEIGGLAKIQIELKLLHDHINQLKVLFNALPQIKTIAADLKNIDTVATKLKTKIDIIVKDKEAIDKVALIDGEIKTIFNNLDAILKAAGAVVSATELRAGIAKIATQDEANNGTDDSKIVTPKKLKGIIDNLIKDRATLETSIRTKLTQLDGVDSDLRKDTDENTSDIATLKTTDVNQQVFIDKNTNDITALKQNTGTAKSSRIFIHYPQDNFNMSVAISDVEDIDFTTRFKIYHALTINGIKDTDWQGYNVLTDDNKYLIQVFCAINNGSYLYRKYDRTAKTGSWQTVQSASTYENITTKSLTCNRYFDKTNNAVGLYLDDKNHVFVKLELSLETGKITYQLGTNSAKEASDKLPEFEFNSIMSITDLSIKTILDIDNVTDNSIVFYNFLSNIGRLVYTTKNVGTVTNAAGFFGYGIKTDDNKTFLQVVAPKLDFDTAKKAIDLEIYTRKIDITTNNVGQWNKGGSDDTFVKLAGYDNTNNKKYIAQRYAKSKIDSLLTGSRITGSGYFGRSCSLNSSGDIVAIGAFRGNYCEIYQLKNGTWTIVGSRITGSRGFSFSCSLNSSGDIVAIGTRNDNYCEIYQLKNGTWTIVGSRITGSGQFGLSCSINSSGDIVAIGAFSGTYCEIYQLKNGTWTIVGSRIKGSGYFGNSCSLNSSGDIVAVGAYGGTYCEIYQLKNGTWTRVGSRITGSGQFGWSCSLNSSGDIVAIGAYSGNYCEIYQLKNGTWTRVGSRITGSGDFGRSCSLNSSGDIVAIGTYDDNYCEIYQLKNGTWTRVGSRITGSGAFGDSCSINSSGDIVAIGTSNGNYCEIYQLKQRLFAGYYVNTNTNIGFLEADIATSAIKYKYKDLLWVNVKDDLADGTFYRMMQTTDRKIYIELAIDDQDKFKFYQANSGNGTQQTFGGGKSKVNTFYKIADKQFQLTRDQESRVYSRAKPAGGAWHPWTDIVGTRAHAAPKIAIAPYSPESDEYYITTNDSVHYYQYKLGTLADQLDNRTKTGKAQWSKWVSVFGVKPVLKLANKDTSGDYIRFLERRIKKLEIRADQ